MKLVNLIDAHQESIFGGKAASLSKGIRGGLPIPDGFVLDSHFVNKIINGDSIAIDILKKSFLALDAAVAVRSSAIGEDSKNASFAGQYLSKLNIKTFSQLINAIIEVAKSVLTESAQAYRRKLEIKITPKMAIIIQKLIFSEVAGVMFTTNPVTKRKEFVIEASWGPGEAVVAGLVVPDYFTLQMDGSISEMKIGIKDMALKMKDDGGIDEIDIDGLMTKKTALTPSDLNKLFQLGKACENLYGMDLDIEWAIKNENVYLLQCRSITA